MAKSVDERVQFEDRVIRALARLRKSRERLEQAAQMLKAHADNQHAPALPPHPVG